MRFEDLRRGHWIVVSLALGAGLAALHNVGFGSRNLDQTHSQVVLENHLDRPPQKGSDGVEHPWVVGLTIYPPAEIGYAVKRGNEMVVPKKSAVTYRLLSPAKDGMWTYRDAVTLVDDPYRPGMVQEGTPGMSLAKLLDQAKKDRPWISYRYAWWMETRNLYLVWMGGMFVLMGLIWPTVQNRLIAAGYGTRSDELPEKKESFWSKWFGKKDKTSGYKDDSVVSSRPQASSGTLSEDDLARIAQMEEGLKDFINRPGDAELGGEVDESALADTPQPAVRKFEDQPLEQAAPTPEKPQDDKDYGGEFYPTVAHGKKKPDNQP